MAQMLARYQAVPAPSKNAGDNIDAEDDEPSTNPASSSLSTLSPKERPRKTILFKFLLVLPGGFLVLAAAVAYLTFLWFGHKTGYAWSRLVLHNWVTTSVVITALVIRTAVATQMTFLTSLLALTILKSGAPIGQVTRLSSLRYSNSGPSELLRILFPSVRHTHILGVFSSTFALAILSLLLQFTSTLLASDLSPGLVETFANRSHSPVLWDSFPDPEQRYSIWTDALTSIPITFPSFAEFSNRSDATQTLHDDRYDDTGPSLRAILPVSTEQGRSDLRSFEGNASIYDARWICTRPTFNMSNLQLQGDGITQTFSGTFSLDDPRPPMVSDEEMEFRCTIQPPGAGYEVTRWHIMTCWMDGNGLVSAVVTEYDTKEQYTISGSGDLLPPKDEAEPMYARYVLGDAVLVINQTDYELSPFNFLFSNGTRWQPSSALGDFRVDFNGSWLTHNRGQWTSVTSTQAAASLTTYDALNSHSAVNGSIKNTTGLSWPFRLDVSFCGSGHHTLKNLYIKAHRQSSQAEPVSVTPGMKQLGATTKIYEFDERGILTLDESVRDVLEQKTDLPTFHFGLLQDKDSYASRVWHYYRDGYTSPGQDIFPVHESRVELLQHTVRETGSISLAMQAAAHTMITTEYYRHLPYFSNDSMLTTSFATPAIQPVRIRGYVVFIVTLGLYTLTTILTIFLLVGLDNWRYISDSLDQSWQAYAQVWTLRDAADKELFADAKATKGMTVQTDAAVKKDFKRQQRLDKQVFALEEDEDGHRVFRRREYKTPKG